MYITLVSPNSGISTLFKFDGNTFVEVPNPAGLTLFGNLPNATYKDLLYYTFKDANLNLFIYSYDGTEFTELNVPNGLDGPAYFGERDGIAYFTFQQDTSSFLTTLYSFDGNAFTEIPIPSYFSNWIYQSSQDENGVYHVYTDDNSVFHILAVDGSMSSVVSPPNGVTGGLGLGGFPRYQATVNGQSYFSVGSVLFYSDGNTSTEVEAPDGYGFAFTVGELNDETYFTYINLVGTGGIELAKMNATGTGVELIDSPASLVGIQSSIIIEDDKIFLNCLNNNSLLTLFSFDGNDFIEFPNPVDKQLRDFQVEENGILYLRYNNLSDGLGTLYKLDINSIPTSNNNILTFAGDVTITPNPTSTDFNLIIQSEKQFNKIDLQLYNSTGQLIQEFNRDIKSRNFQQRINIQNLSNGIYFLIGKTDVGSFQRKVVKI